MGGVSDIQRFDSTGTWIKPGGATAVDVILKGGGSWSGAAATAGTHFSHYPEGSGGAGISASGCDAGDGELVAWSFPASALPPRMTVQVGRGGYALVVTHLSGS